MEKLKFDSFGDDDDLLSGLRLSNNHTALDFGLGTGHMSTRLLDLGMTVYAIDLDPETGSNFEASLSEENRERFSFQQLDANARTYPIEDVSFDLIVCREVLEHVFEYESAINEFRRVLKSGGVLAISVPTSRSERVFRLFDRHWYEKCQHCNVFPTDTLRNLLIDRGFEVVNTRGTGFRWSIMWLVLAPFATNHVMGTVNTPTTWFRLVYRLSEVLAKGKVKRIGNRLFPKSQTCIAVKRPIRLLIIYDYPDWILKTWATEISKKIGDEFSVHLISMFDIDDKYVRKERRRFDIVHALLPHAFALAKSLEPTTLIPTIHHWTDDAVEYRTMLNNDYQLVTSSSQWQRRIIEKGVNPSRVRVFRSGAPDHFFTSVAGRRPDDSHINVGFFAKPDSNEDDRKGTRLLELVVNMIGAKNVGSCYNFVLSGGDWPSLVDLLRKNGCSVHIANRVPRSDMVHLYDSLDVYLVLSRIEGGPATVAEAMARGKIVISTPVGLSLDVIDHGVNGILLSSSNVVLEAFDQLESLRKDPVRRSLLGQQARSFAERELRYEHTFKGIQAFYWNCWTADNDPTYQCSIAATEPRQEA